MKRIALYVAGASFVLVAVVGLLHAPFAQALLARAGGCPFPTADHVPTQAEADALRIAAALCERGTTSATLRPALGFTLDATTREQVRAWARSEGVRCDDDTVGLGLRCRDVTLDALPGRTIADAARAEVSFGFDLEGRLVSTLFIARVPPPADAASVREAAVSELSALGPPTRVVGAAPDRVFARRVDAWAYADYVGEVTATNVGSGVIVTARHLSIPN